MVFVDQAIIDVLAGRIERAYVVRRPEWTPGRSAPGVWSAAARALLQAHHDHPSVPLDPELYVAAQVIPRLLVDPWAELTQEASVRRFRRRIRKIVASLRRELRGEVRLALRRIDKGEEAATVLLSKSPSLSPLGRFIVARRTGRHDLAERLKAEASSQHAMCPLYRPASRTLLASELYPVHDPCSGQGPVPLHRSLESHAARN